MYVEKIIIHENYNTNTIDNDIAILKLKTPLIFNDDVQPACLPHSNFAPEKYGQIGVVSGWGSLSEGISFHNCLLESSSL